MTGDPHLYYSSFSDELLAKFQRVGHLVAHNSTTGTYHEEILRSVLRNFLSRRFSVKTGFVYKNETEVISNQLDIIVVDENEVGAYLYQEGDLAIVRPRAAVAVIEVKTHLDGQRFGQAFTNIASVRRLESKIQGFVFGYESSKLTDKVRMITSRSATAVSSGSRSTGQHWGCGPKWARAGNCRSCSH